MPAAPPAPQIKLDPAPADARPTGERNSPQSSPSPTVVVAKPLVLAKPEPQIEPELTRLSPWAA
jgi:hypothetical protein